jgi:hypothetical protein
VERSSPNECWKGASVSSNIYLPATYKDRCFSVEPDASVLKLFFPYKHRICTTKTLTY